MRRGNDHLNLNVQTRAQAQNTISHDQSRLALNEVSILAKVLICAFWTFFGGCGSVGEPEPSDSPLSPLGEVGRRWPLGRSVIVSSTGGLGAGAPLRLTLLGGAP